MQLAVLIVLTLSVLTQGVIAIHYFRTRHDLHAWVEAAISSEVKRQDDRIQKRLMRSEDAISTEGDLNSTGMPRIGQPYYG